MTKRYYSKKHKEQKGKRNKIYIVGYSVLVFSLIFSLGYFSRYDNFEFNNVEVSGIDDKYVENIELVVEESLRSTSFFWLISKGTSFTYNKSEIRKKLLNEFPKIDRLIIRSGGDRTLEIIISERESEYLWCSDSCYITDKEGIAYEVVDRQYISTDILKINDNMNSIVLGEPIVEEENLEEIVSLVKYITNYGYVLDYFNISKEGHYDLVLDSETIIKFTSIKNINIQLENFKSTFSEKDGNLDISKYEYIDLRFDNRIYKKTKSEEENVEEDVI